MSAHVFESDDFGLGSRPDPWPEATFLVGAAVALATTRIGTGVRDDEFLHAQAKTAARHEAAMNSARREGLGPAGATPKKLLCSSID